jgi:hypothetical protein
MTDRETLRALLAERDAARAAVARWRDECERLRIGGCARGQTTTQWCAEAVDMMAQRDHWRAVATDRGQKVAAAFARGAEAMREAIKKRLRAYPFDLKHSGPITDALKCVDETAVPLPDMEDKQ